MPCLSSGCQYGADLRSAVVACVLTREQWQGAATKDPSLLEKIAKLTFLRDQARIEQAVAEVKQLFSAKIYGQLLRTVGCAGCCRIFSRPLTITSRGLMKTPSLISRIRTCRAHAHLGACLIIRGKGPSLYVYTQTPATCRPPSL